MSYVLAHFQGTVYPDGHIEAGLTDARLLDGPRPKSGDEFDADQDALERINARTPGQINSIVRLGVGEVVTLNRESLTSLEWGGEFSKIEERYGRLTAGAIFIFKDLGAPGGAWWKVDIAAGVLQTSDLVTGALQELVEISPYTNEGWFRYTLEVDGGYQQVIDDQQGHEWARLKRTMQGRFPADFQQAGEITVQNLKAPDVLNGRSCLLRAEPKNGTLEFCELKEARLQGSRIMFQDSEHWIPGQIDAEGPSEVPLDRGFVLVCQREHGAPIMFMFKRGLEMGMFPSILEGENIERLLNEKTTGVLEHLGWIETKTQNGRCLS